jgi:hypothetical protein
MKKTLLTIVALLVILAPVGVIAETMTGIKCNLHATTDPTQTDNWYKKYERGSIWLNTTDGHVFFCTDNGKPPDHGAPARWTQVTFPDALHVCALEDVNCSNPPYLYGHALIGDGNDSYVSQTLDTLYTGDGVQTLQLTRLRGDTSLVFAGAEGALVFKSDHVDGFVFMNSVRIDNYLTLQPKKNPSKDVPAGTLAFDSGKKDFVGFDGKGWVSLSGGHWVSIDGGISYAGGNVEIAGAMKVGELRNSSTITEGGAIEYDKAKEAFVLHKGNNQSFNLAETAFKDYYIDDNVNCPKRENLDSFEEFLGQGAEWKYTIFGLQDKTVRSGIIIAGWNDVGDVVFSEIMTPVNTPLTGSGDGSQAGEVRFDVTNTGDTIYLYMNMNVDRNPCSYEVSVIRTLIPKLQIRKAR